VKSDRKSKPMSKAGNRRLRTQRQRSPETARQQDPQLAAIYHNQMVNKGAVHTEALCAVAAPSRTGPNRDAARHTRRTS
jgi:hypothetical protein